MGVVVRKYNLSQNVVDEEMILWRMEEMSMSSENCTASSSGTMLYWDEHDIAGYFWVSTRTIQRWVRSGQLPPPFRMGRKRLWMPDQVKEWMARQGKDAEAEAEKERQRLANYSWKGGK